ncbi:DUF5667 domain-containing protein [Nocardioides sp.]|uniref:DUF5667 domain-containing protein n=1 Tax=Nocardioides sp. TaxID=35761 RepID=UPI0031FEB4A9|nr:hypothetical protein [Nocardioides sp.]
MTPVFAARRRAEEFNLLVEDLSTGVLRDARYVEFLELVGALRDTSPVEARPEFVASLRERLMAEADSVLAKAPTGSARTLNDRLTVAPRRTARERRFAVAIGGFAIVGATTSMAVAAQSALPGDALYPLKRAIENAHTGFSVDDSSKGSTLLANASGRLDEVDALTRAGADSGDAAAIADTLGTFSAQASEASDLLMADYQNTGRERSISELRDFASSALASLSGFESVVPVGARGALITAARTLLQIDTSAQSLCPDCGGASIDIVPPFVTEAVDNPFNTVAQIFTIDTTRPGRHLQPVKHPGAQQGADAPVDQPGDATTAEGSQVGPLPADSSHGDGPTRHHGGNGGPISHIADLLGGNQPASNPDGGLPDLGPVDDVLGDVGNILGGVLGNNTPTP